MAGSIICGVDGSESAKGAARVARGLSAQLGLPLLFVRVVEAAAREEAASVPAERPQQLRESGAAVDGGAAWLVETGYPVDRLVAVAADRDASLIVVGSHGPRSSLLGSVSAEVSRRAACPVVVVPPGADAELASGRGGTRFAARLGLGSTRRDQPGATADYSNAVDSAGGIVRFNLGSRADMS